MTEEPEDGGDQPESDAAEPPDDAPEGYSLVFKDADPDDVETNSESADDDS